MSAMTSGSAERGSAIDLTQFFAVFFEEATENLDGMEHHLLNADLQTADDETLNSIFRCAHSVKGGAATFGFTDMAELTHEMETLLDRLRRHEVVADTAMVDLLLHSVDTLRAQLACHRDGGTDAVAVDTGDLLLRYQSLTAAANDCEEATAAEQTPGTPAEAAEGPTHTIELAVICDDSTAPADTLMRMFHQSAHLGTATPLSADPVAKGENRFMIVTSLSDQELLAQLGFHLAPEQVRIIPADIGYGFFSDAPGMPCEEGSDAGFGFFSDAPGAPQSDVSPHVESSTEPEPVAAPSRPVTPARADSTTLRVPVEKVDQLVNLVGELVITQAMLAQTSKELDLELHQQIMAGLGELERNTRDLQEAVMSIRMIPMSTVFNRFPRMLRDLASKLGKQVEFVTKGEATELDKGLVEKIIDPLTHLVRNSCDHGIEPPAERLAVGKPAHGTITLSASHQGGSIMIEVRDDGRGLPRQKLIDKARQRGLNVPDSISDSEAWALIFAPGFSTADVVTDVSGRGVGMDVVKKNIGALGGSVDIEAAEGFGMSVKVRLPLTLAIMDAMSVGVGDECYILPLASVVESFQMAPDKIRTVGGSGRVVQVRDEFLPIIALAQVFDVPRRYGVEAGEDIIVVVESDGVRVALQVDALLGQQQVVVKNLESNYRKVAHISGATIMGDGRVALILDVGSLARRSRH
ncbi:MAG: hypothetical protein AMXMBFR6_11090 [Betaproteobacteria bacterium]